MVQTFNWGQFYHKFFAGELRPNLSVIEDSIEWIYERVGVACPKITFVESPLMTRIELLDMERVSGHQPIPLDKARDFILRAIRSNEFDQGTAIAPALSRDSRQVIVDLATKLFDLVQMDVQKRTYSSLNDLGYLDSIGIDLLSHVINSERIAVKNCAVLNPEFLKARCLLTSGFYEAVFLQDRCIVSAMPNAVNRDSNGRFHSNNDASIHFSDGYKIYCWHGVPVPRTWIEEKESINWQVIRGETNAERRRCLCEILGTERYFQLQGGVILIDEDFDAQGNEMRLFMSRRKDTYFRLKVQFLEVTCPSTKRKYVLYPPNQRSKNVWEAKASTFNNERIQVRQGDVGLLNMTKKFKRPQLET